MGNEFCRFKGTTPNTYGYALANPLKYTDSLGLDVYVCGRPADLPFPLNQLNHEWLLTDTLERGMGPAGGVPAQGGNSELPFSPTDITEHRDQSLADNSHCDHVQNVDEQCVNDSLQLGQPTGRFGPWNNCQTTVTDILIRCSTQ
ncbi:hypothetical protein [sulfur-oxidizing endosymbiont of Gigantopelta aegis]|uniref:hypothetical protein n=1 Tax=sulfur-oxidizing endosymbiont of Gigantopelta aegis TaxID=2794934 RepID=UPI0018DC04B4|nr:hypothetical protein [sulfur-oxidizing endosymbiont of Gigantopelta aegis]